MVGLLTKELGRCLTHQNSSLNGEDFLKLSLKNPFFPNGETFIQENLLNLGRNSEVTIKKIMIGTKWYHSCQKPIIAKLDLIPDPILVSTSPLNIILTSLEFSGHTPIG